MFVLLVLLFYADIANAQHWKLLYYLQLNTTLLIQNLTSDIIKDTDQRMSAMEQLKLGSIRSIDYEVGFVMYLIHEAYRKMLDIYNTTHSNQKYFYPMESIMMMHEVEMQFWTIEHLCNMLHEIERKWAVRSVHYQDDNDEYGEYGPNGPRSSKGWTRYVVNPRTRPQKTKSRFKKGLSKAEKIEIVNRERQKPTLPPTPKRGQWPLIYGWEIDYVW